MTRKEAMRQTHQQDVLRSLGFTNTEAEQLRRISMTLRRWHEMECGTDNGCVERDEATGKAVWRNSYTGRTSPIADRETGAKKRLAVIIEARNKREWHPVMPEPVRPYIQGDPRGAALYLLRAGDVPAGQDDGAYYSRGICVY